jgi:signal transduction histidine kinase
VIIEVIDDGTSTQESNEMEPIRSADDAPATATLARGIRTGIGLQLVRGLVGRELHGTFSLREKPDGGTIATVEFPIGAQPAQC